MNILIKFSVSWWLFSTFVSINIFADIPQQLFDNFNFIPSIEIKANVQYQYIYVRINLSKTHSRINTDHHLPSLIGGHLSNGRKVLHDRIQQPLKQFRKGHARDGSGAFQALNLPQRRKSEITGSKAFESDLHIGLTKNIQCFCSLMIPLCVDLNQFLLSLEKR